MLRAGWLTMTNTKMKKIVIKSPAEMEKFSRAVAKSLKGGVVLALTGELGAGKTSFVKGLAKALGIRRIVQSPTFLLMKCYPTPKAIRAKKNIHDFCHVDAYRIKKDHELMAIGFVEHLEDDGTVMVVEWANLVQKLIPPEALWIDFEHGERMLERIVTLQMPNH